MERREVIINVRDLVYAVIRRWRLLVIVGLAGGAVVAGCLFWTSWRAQAKEAQSEEELVADEEEVNPIEEEISAIEEQIADNLEKIEEDQEQIEKKEESIALWEEVREEAWQRIGEYENVLSFAADAVETAAAQAQGDLAAAMVAANDGIVALRKWIITIGQTIEALQGEIETLQEEIDTVLPEKNEQLLEDIEELKEALAEEAEAESEPDADAEDGISVRKLLKGAIFGVLAGLVIAGAYLFLRYCLERKLHDADTLRLRYRYFFLGSLYRPFQKGNRLDRALADWAGYPADGDEESAYRGVAASLMAQEETGTIFLTGTVPTDWLEEVSEKLAPRLSAAGIMLEVQPGFVRSPEGILRLKNRPVIVAEAKDRSALGGMDRQAELLEAVGARVVGAILL